MKSHFDTAGLPPGIWFVRSGKGGGVMPVTPEGRRVVRLFALGMVASGALGGVLAGVTGSLWWLAIVVIGMTGSAVWFVTTAMRHADRTINYSELLRKSGT
jgi:hypothetical protein